MFYGVLKCFEIVWVLVMKLCLIFFDELVVGLNFKEIIEVDYLVCKVVDFGVIVVLVEYDMKMVMNFLDCILVFDYGKKLVEGSGEEVCQNFDVIVVYLGVYV